MSKCFLEKIYEYFKQHCIHMYLKYCENNNLNVIRNVLVIIFRPNVLILINIFQKHLMNNFCNIVLMYLGNVLKIIIQIL